ncbi:hypothetical protein A1O3_00632 [Capronia epimyces CBS 606.96]|uniref:BZIP domain-containing protein n=1 Tax=Capronia epimyces CBS 606.96 TaxID=1182542 RepID=W9YGQ8_9EURO|nr:uncharacterized protein A1O3_00632 [Capronia epimyces CBS 606.96]EXJ92082.1 hypothetical protein A1O3_00632 [Capronia epimyces CBS 606.96]
MDYGFVGSPSQSPNQSFFTTGHYFDSTSESSSPSSPHQINRMMLNSAPLHYDMFQYGATPSSYYPATQSAKISVEYNDQTTLGANVRRRRRSGSTSAPTKDKDTITNMHLRRRAQNRASQRAFRERKEKHVKGLELQLEDIHEKHQDLLQTYTRQSDEVAKLNNRIAELTTEINSLRSCQDQSFSDMLLPDKFDKFDAFSGHDMLHDGPDCYFDKTAVDLNSEFSLHSFEDSL